VNSHTIKNTLHPIPVNEGINYS